MTFSKSSGGAADRAPGADTARQERVQAFAVAWLAHHLHGGADAWIEGTEADRAAGRIG